MNCDPSQETVEAAPAKSGPSNNHRHHRSASTHTLQVLPLDSLRTDGGTQPREEINTLVVSEFAEAMTEGAPFPPIAVFFDGAEYWIADGFHRYHAARKIEALDISAEVRSGTQRDAILYAAGANATHGLRRTNTDKRRAVMTLLNDEEWSKWSDREIAKRCAVSDRFVSSLRTVRSDTPAPTERTYTDKHGKTGRMNTARIGRRRHRKPANGQEQDDAIRAELAKNDGGTWGGIAGRIGATRSRVQAVAHELGIDGRDRRVVRADDCDEDAGDHDLVEDDQDDDQRVRPELDTTVRTRTRKQVSDKELKRALDLISGYVGVIEGATYGLGTMIVEYSNVPEVQTKIGHFAEALLWSGKEIARMLAENAGGVQ